MHLKRAACLYIEDVPQDCIDACVHHGDCSADVEHWRERLSFSVDPQAARDYIRGWGAHSEEELAAMDADTLADYILWEACWTFKEYQETGGEQGASDVFMLDS